MALPTASDNPFPSILITEGTEPAAPAAGKQRLYIDSTTHKLKRTDSSGTDVTIEGIAAGAVTSSGLTQATARLLGRTTASTGAIEEITVGTGLSLSAGALTATGGGRGLSLSAGALTATGGGSTPAFVGVRAKRTTAQTITTATVTAIAYNAADDFDTNAFHDPASNNTKLIVPSGKDGYYLAIANLQWDVSTAGTRIVGIKKNGTTQVAEVEYNPNVTVVDGIGATVSCIVNLAATDYLEVVVYHTKGSNLDTRAAAEGCNFQMTLLGT